MLGLLLFAPALPLLGVAVLMNPAAKTTCLAGDLMVTVIPDTLSVTTGGGATISLGRAQLAHAAAIIMIGARTRDTGRDGVVIALMAALAESGLRMLANTTAWPESAGYPHDGDGQDHDSLGLFQMRPQAGWGSVEQLMDPAYQIRAFYGGPAGPNNGSPPGLLDLAGWRTMPKGEAAQTVEVSAYPDRYQHWEPAAQQILNTLTQPADGGQPGDPAVPETTTIVFPLPAGTWVKTSGFGPRIHPISGRESFHQGTDYAAPDGTAILAAADGLILAAGPLGGYGNAIIIRHTIGGQDIASLYGHMWDGHLYVAAGQQVAAGQHIADVGSNGNSTGPHLHIEIRPDNQPSQAVDPDLWLAQHGATSQTDPGVSTTGCHTGGR